jgi:hypothetical protein
MLNPYAATTVETCRNDDAPSVVDAVAMGVIGYCSPLAIFAATCWLRFGRTVVIENLERFSNAHVSLSLSTVALLLPNLVCMVLFAYAGYRHSFAKRSLALGLATLLGYFMMVLTTMVWFPLPWTWNAVTANAVRSLIVIAFPSFLLILRHLRRDRL